MTYVESGHTQTHKRLKLIALTNMSEQSQRSLPLLPAKHPGRLCMSNTTKVAIAVQDTAEKPNPPLRSPKIVQAAVKEMVKKKTKKKQRVAIIT